MSVHTVAAVLLLVALVPAAVQLYLHRLPVAPSCPSCRSTTRVVQAAALLRWVPALPATSLGECGACGWRGRMRWRWAPRSVRGDR